MKYQNILVFDFETTGVNPFEDEIIEIGAIKLELINQNYEIVEELSVLVKQDKPLPEKITEITGITDEMLELDGVSRSEAFQMFKNLYTEDSLLIAYNIQFDIWFLINLFYKEQDRFFELKMTCLMRWQFIKTFIHSRIA